MTYANAVLPHALFIAAQLLAGGGFPRHGRSIVCLPRPRDDRRGSLLAGRKQGWYPRGEEKSPYDQQPVEAVTMAEAALAALALLGDGDGENTWLPSAAPTAGSMAAIA